MDASNTERPHTMHREKPSMKPLNDTDRLLIQGIRHGSIKAFEQIFVRFYPRFYSFALGLVKEEWVAEDVVQNVFMKVWLRRATLHDDEPLYVYIYVLTKYEVYNYFRSKRTRLVERLSEQNLPDIIDGGIEEAFRQAELQKALEDAIEELPPRRRDIFRMSRFEYMSAREIADRTGLSVRTVEKHIELALRDLRSRLSPFLFLLTVFFNI